MIKISNKWYFLWGLLFLFETVMGQKDSTISVENIPTLNKIAGEYDWWKLVFGASMIVITFIMVLWNTFGLNVIIKTKANEWIQAKIAREADLNVEHIKAAVREFAKISELKKKKILVLSAAEGQQGDLKKVFDGCGFSNVQWENIAQLSGLVLNGVDLILLNDQPELRLTQVQIEDVFKKFKSNVPYQYFGPDNKLPIGQYRTDYPKLLLGLCNSADRLETGILSLLKIA